MVLEGSGCMGKMAEELFADLGDGAGGVAAGFLAALFVMAVLVATQLLDRR